MRRVVLVIVDCSEEYSEQVCKSVETLRKRVKQPELLSILADEHQVDGPECPRVDSGTWHQGREL